jgi:hypothetical protein
VTTGLVISPLVLLIFAQPLLAAEGPVLPVPTCSDVDRILESGDLEVAEELYKSILESEASSIEKSCAIDGLIRAHREEERADRATATAAARTKCSEAEDLADAGADDEAIELYSAVLESSASQQAKKCAVDGLSDLSLGTRAGAGRALLLAARTLGLIATGVVLLYALRLLLAAGAWSWLALRHRAGPVSVDDLKDGTLAGTLETGALGVSAAVREELLSLGVPSPLPAAQNFPRMV